MIAVISVDSVALNMRWQRGRSSGRADCGSARCAQPSFLPGTRDWHHTLVASRGGMLKQHVGTKMTTSHTFSGYILPWNCCNLPLQLFHAKTIIGGNFVLESHSVMQCAWNLPVQYCTEENAQIPYVQLLFTFPGKCFEICRNTTIFAQLYRRWCGHVQRQQSHVVGSYSDTPYMDWLIILCIKACLVYKVSSRHCSSIIHISLQHKLLCISVNPCCSWFLSSLYKIE